MNIGLDFDDTYTRDPIAWDLFIQLMKSRGHYVYMVTWRDEQEAQEIRENTQLMNLLDGLYATNRKNKAKFMFDKGICIDVVIDDMPIAWATDMQPYSASGLWV